MKYNYQLLTPDQIQQYLNRINFKKNPDNSLKCLNELIYCHHINVPFENLDVYYKQLPLSLEINDLFQKIVIRKRGGYCFELNGLFISLLQSLSFKAWSCICRVTHNENLANTISHRGNIVILNGNHYFCDVGFGGPMPCGALLLKDHFTQQICGENFTPIFTDEGWWKIMYGDICTLMVSESFFDPLDFAPLSNWCSLRDNSIFRQMLKLNRKTPSGYVSINADLFTEVDNGIRKEQKITSEDELRKILSKYFNLSL